MMQLFVVVLPGIYDLNNINSSLPVLTGVRVTLLTLYSYSRTRQELVYSYGRNLILEPLTTD